MKDKIFDYALKVFLTLGAIFYVAVRNPVSIDAATVFGYLSQERFFIFGTFVLFALSLTVEPKRILKIFSLAGFCIFVLLTSLLFGFGGDLQRKTTNIFIGLLLYKVIFENFNFKNMKSYAWWFGFLLMLNLAMCVLQRNGLDNIFTGTSPAYMVGNDDKLIGFMRLKAHLGLIAALFSVFIAAYAPLFLLCVAPLLFFGKVSASVLAVVVGFTSWLWFKMKRVDFFLLFGILLFLGAGYVIFYDMPTGQFGERFKVWHAAFGHLMLASPIMGEGIGSFALTNFTTPNNPGYPPNYWMWAHNDLLQVFFETGAIGMAFIFSFLVARYKDFQILKADKTLQVLFSTFLVLLIIAFFNFPFHLGRFAHLFIFFIAIYHARACDLRKELV